MSLIMTSSVQQDDWCTPAPTLIPANASNTTASNATTDSSVFPYCANIFDYTIPQTHIRIWDLVLLVVNLLQVLFLMFRLITKCKKLRKSMALFPVLFALVLLISASVMVSNIVCMIVGYQHVAYKILRLWLRFVIFVTEISVIVFGMFFKRYKDSKLCLGVTLCTIIIFAGLYTAGEGVSEFLGDHSALPCSSYSFFTSGGMLFLFCSSFLLSAGYFTAYMVYCTNCHKKWHLPSKKSFYRYCLFLSCVNLIQAIASMLWYNGSYHQAIGEVGICLIALTQFTYQTTFAPMIYWIFLHRFFKSSPRYRKLDKSNNKNLNVSDDDSQTVKLDKRRTTSQSSNLPTSTPYRTSQISPSPQQSPTPSPSSADRSFADRSLEQSAY